MTIPPRSWTAIRLMAETTAEIRAAYPRIDADHRARLEQAGPEVFRNAVEKWYREWRNRIPLLVEPETERDSLLAKQ